MHAFRAWSGGAQDPTSDPARYLLLRGDSDIEPTIDPPTTRPDDYRMLLSVGPVPIVEPGQVVHFSVVLRCGSLVPGVGMLDEDLVTTGSTRSTFGERIVVAPNPVRLATAGAPESVRFLSLPDGARVQIYSAAGRLVRTLDPQADSVSWDLRASGGSTVAAGIYFYRIDGLDGAKLGKLVVLR